jgi:hypothetical protein
VYGDANDRWVRTRKIWNEHSYPITNVNVSGSLPQPEPESWTAGSPNNYRVSAQGAGVYNAPDLKVDLEVSTQSCPLALTLRARVKNEGALGVLAGVNVRFYEGTSAAGALLAEEVTTGLLLPGQSEVVQFEFPLTGPSSGLSFYVAVDGALANGTELHECNDGNNDASAGWLQCPVVK